MKTAYFYLTPEGEALAKRLSLSHPGDLYGKNNFRENMKLAFENYNSLVCIMATGIVVRILAPLLSHKTKDPAVVVLDQKGKYAVSLLSGHLGGANDLAREMAAISGGEAVITTATDVAGRISFDTFARRHNLAIENIGQLKKISGALLAGEQICVFTDQDVLQDDPELLEEEKKGILEIFSLSPPFPMPAENFSAVVIDEGFTFPDSEFAQFPVLYLRPRTICAGIGCKRGTSQEAIEAALFQTLKEAGISPLSLKCIATIPLKADEPGIIKTASKHHLPLEIIPTEQIEALDMKELGIETSAFVAGQTGVQSVSTACSYLASHCGKILRDKAKYKGVTIALSRERS
ncbi:MAG: cobalt-precorrin 5A hydrolase [Eubacterium sp.]|nr:cobalt-precorrin 5A hydrolase [Eubacterium sp.]MDD7208484.1 cobalt-precorrin 5A hydrolase [Lachnospiraceae bacterium]MDY5497607.1 cobalt-precorrin 5A hydrolase [Anaerobutyricum sp.]